MKKKLEFTDQELNIILYSLQKQPFEMVNDIIHSIAAQLKAANEFKQETVLEETENKK